MNKITMIDEDDFSNKTSITRQFDEETDIYTMSDIFQEFLRGCGYSEGLINEIIK